MKLHPRQAIVLWDIIQGYARDKNLLAEFEIRDFAYPEPQTPVPLKPEVAAALAELSIDRSHLFDEVVKEPTEIIPLREVLSAQEIVEFEQFIGQAVHGDQHPSFPTTPTKQTITLTDEQRGELMERVRRHGFTEQALVDHGVLQGNELQWASLIAKARLFNPEEDVRLQRN